MGSTVQISRPKSRKAASVAPAIDLGKDRLVATAEAAQLIGQTPKTLREWRSKRMGPPALKMGSGQQARVLYSLRGLEQWIQASVTSVTGGNS